MTKPFIYPVLAGHSPCRNCTDRKLKCHADCKRYREWIEKLDGVKEQRKVALAYSQYQRDKIQRAEAGTLKGSTEYKRRFKA